MEHDVGLMMRERHRTLGSLLVDASASHADSVAVVTERGSVTYGGLRAQADRTAAGLLGAGVTPGAHVMIVGGNTAATAATFFGVARAGAVSVMVNPRSTPSELRQLIEIAHPAAVVTPGDVPLARATDPGTLDERSRAIDVHAPATVLFTSGTTAKPKGVVHSHASLIASSIARVSERLPPGVGTRHWCPTPMFHSAALGVLVGSVALGTTFLTMESFDPEAALEMIERHEVDCAWTMFPPFVQALSEAFARTPRRVTSVRHSTMVLDPAAIRLTEALFPNATVVSGYGMTEVAGMVCMPDHDADSHHRTQTCGRPFSGMEVGVIDPDAGDVLPSDSAGELAVKGYAMFDRYLGDPVATAAAMTPRGWFRTGDLGTVDRDGTVGFRGRMRDVLKVGGESVSPVEVEALLLHDHDVTAAAVVGRPHPRLGEVPVAFVELAHGATTSAEDLVSRCAAELSSFKVPRTIVLVSPGSWPMSATKIDKVELRRRAASLP